MPDATMNNGLDYSELDKWMADLDELQRDLNRLRPQTVGASLPPMCSKSSASKANAGKPEGPPTRRVANISNGDQGDFFIIAHKPQITARPTRVSDRKLPAPSVGFQHNEGSISQVTRANGKLTCSGYHVPKVIVATTQAHDLGCSKTSPVQHSSVRLNNRPQTGPPTKECKTVHWSRDIECPTDAKVKRVTTENNYSRPRAVQQHEFQQHDPISNWDRPKQTRHMPRSHSVNRADQIHTREKRLLREFSFPINLVDYTRGVSPTIPCPEQAQNQSTVNGKQPNGMTIKAPSTFEQPDVTCPDELWLPQNTHEQRIPSPVVNISPEKQRQPLLQGTHSQTSAKYDVHRSSDSSQAARSTSKGRQLVLRVYQPDKTTKAIAIDSHTTAFDVIKVMLSKNMLTCSTKYALVEKIPSMKLERCFEDSERMMDCLINWNMSSENLVFFEEREDMYGMFENPKIWLGGQIPVSDERLEYETAKDIFICNNELNLPNYSEHLYVRTNDTAWKRRFCLLRNSGLYISRQNSKDISAFRRIIGFKPYLHLYTTSGGWTKLNAPTPFGLTIRAFSSRPTDIQNTVHFCAISEASLRIWNSLLRLALAGPRLLDDYANRVEHAIGDLTHRRSKRASFSVVGYDCVVSPTETANSIQWGPRTASLNRFDPKTAFDDAPSPRVIGSGTCSTNGSHNELGCVTGRPDVRLSTRSVNGLSDSEVKRTSSTASSSFTSLFHCATASDREEDSVPPSSLRFFRRGRCANRFRKKVLGSGPAARRCTRSISHISAPFNVLVPSQVNERSTQLPLRKPNTTDSHQSLVDADDY